MITPASTQALMKVLPSFVDLTCCNSAVLYFIQQLLLIGKALNVFICCLIIMGEVSNTKAFPFSCFTFSFSSGKLVTLVVTWPFLTVWVNANRP